MLPITEISPSGFDSAKVNAEFTFYRCSMRQLRYLFCGRRLRIKTGSFYIIILSDSAGILFHLIVLKLRIPFSAR